MTECTKVLPAFIPTFTSPDQPQLSKYVYENDFAAAKESTQLLNGNKINT